MNKAILLIGLLFYFLFGGTSVWGQTKDQVSLHCIAGKISTHQHASFASNPDAKASLEVLLPDFDEENSSNETGSTSYKNRISFVNQKVETFWFSSETTAFTTEFLNSLSNYLVPFIGFSTPIYITQRVIRI